MRLNPNNPIPLRAFFLLAGAALLRVGAPAQTPQRLTLQEADAIALKNHPQIQAAQNELNAAAEQIIINRAPYYPAFNGEITGSQGNNLSRLGAGDISASRLFDRFGQGAVLNQLITDSGRTPSLVASARLQSRAAEQNLSAARYDVILAVHRAYFGVLQAQAVVKVAQQTVDARQLLADQVTELARNNLKSQLDVSEAEVTVSQAKLILLDAQEAVTAAYAELARALGSDQSVNYQLAEEQLPPGPPQNVEDLVAQAMRNRPELASLQYSRESAQKFYEAERDLKRPTVSVVAVGGFIPFINTPGNAPIPKEYEAVAANVNIPVFNGHLFSAREEAARQRALEAEQRIRDQQERISRDVRVAYSSAVAAFQRIDVTAQFLRQAALALDLAQGRYNLGLSSIVELTQAQLNLTEAEIQNVGAKYGYEAQYAALEYAIGVLH
ncbi:MAG TPA: TolC family protein [Bryobacteraceae bacterium]|jgi:outer membrane protein|nr:TolC family protein [Bryobacteraceae bacterium]